MAHILEIPAEFIDVLWEEYRRGGGSPHWEDFCVKKFGYAIKFGTQNSLPFCYITFLSDEDLITFKLTYL